MKKRVVVAKEVHVPEWFFKNEGGLMAFPRRVELDGREYTFMDGLRYLVRKGQQMTQVFDMTDGSRDYRLQFDDTRRSCTLVDMTM
jgi:hypothetical protein